MTRLVFECSDEKAVALLRAARLFDEGEPIEPMKHAQWIQHVDYDRSGYAFVYYRCSACRRIERQMENYCHCGARMDGEPEDENDS